MVNQTKENSCCVIGHREVNNLNQQLLTDKFKNLIEKYNVTIFKFGNYGKFNNLCYKILRELKLQYQQIKLVLYSLCNEIAYTFEEAEKYQSQYNRRNTKFKYKCFDEIIELKDIDESKFKYACVLRNKRLIDESDFCVIYYRESYSLPCSNGVHRNSGTKIAFEYAIKKNKKVFIT